jgi:predicted Zn-dependent protease with MMP-like domain
MLEDSNPRRLWQRLIKRRQRQIMAEQAWEELVERSESLARSARPPADENGEFEQLVADAVDQLPKEFRRVLEEVPIVVSDRGLEHNAYGLYQGDGATQDWYTDRIMIFRDTLERDFGHDRQLLQAQVERTVRHEIAHHLGWDERGVRDLGL